MPTEYTTVTRSLGGNTQHRSPRADQGTLTGYDIGCIVFTYNSAHEMRTNQSITAFTRGQEKWWQHLLVHPKEFVFHPLQSGGIFIFQVD